MVENFQVGPTPICWQFQRLFGAQARDHSDGLPIKPKSLALAMSYLSIYKIIDNILPLSGAGSADLQRAGHLGESTDRFTFENPKHWELKVNYIAFPHQPLQIHADLPLVSTSEQGKHPYQSCSVECHQ